MDGDHVIKARPTDIGGCFISVTPGAGSVTLWVWLCLHQGQGGRRGLQSGTPKPDPKTIQQRERSCLLSPPPNLGVLRGALPLDGGATITPGQVRASQDRPFHPLFSDGCQSDDPPAGAIPHHRQGQCWRNTGQGPPKIFMFPNPQDTPKPPSAAQTPLCSQILLQDPPNPSVLPESSPKTPKPFRGSRNPLPGHTQTPQCQPNSSVPPNPLPQP